MKGIIIQGEFGASARTRQGDIRWELDKEKRQLVKQHSEGRTEGCGM